jgi:ferritin-like metal-binding protein YciE
MSADSLQEQLVKYLADAHSIEEQALTQLRAAPKIAGDEGLAAAFAEHLGETERQEEIVRERLEAHGADPSKLKDLAGKAGGWGMVLFAKAQPDTPGKLTAHAFSYEHMELAAYELLRRAAEAAGDAETTAAARTIGAEERRMAERLESRFDGAVRASLRDLDPDELGEQLDSYLADAHAIEQQAIGLLEKGPGLVHDEALAELFHEHLEQTKGHSDAVAARLRARGADTSAVKDAALRIGALNLGGFFGAQPDTTAKLSGFAYAFENLEIGAYELLKRVAAQAGDTETVRLAERVLAEERAAAEKLAAGWDRTMRLQLAGRA